ncbi:MAG: AAA family ATPase [Sphingomonadaceae bacterium]|nr:AAA family ATPase [Sphingomonadaceae bacterium]
MGVVIGQESAAAQFLAAWSAGRLHHAWLLAGPEGVGKRTFADSAARMVLAGAPTFGVADDHPAARLIAAGSHPDLIVIERPLRKNGELGKEIVLVQLRGGTPDKGSTLESIEYRGILKLFQSTSALAEWRVVIIDAVDDLNTQSANSLLKSLEEPPARTLFLLVSHAPGRLLPTIRSRCRRLRFDLLTPAETAAVLAEALPESPAVERAALERVAAGAPGRAVAYAGLHIGELQAALDTLAAAAPHDAPALGLKLAQWLQGKAGQPRFEALLDLAPRTLAAHARTAPDARLPALLDRWERAQKLADEAVPLSLEQQSVVAELAGLVAGAAAR